MAGGMTGTRPQRKKQEMTCAELPKSSDNRRQAHAPKEKSKKWRVRSCPSHLTTADRHTPQRKKQEMACAELPKSSDNRCQTHAPKEKSKK